MNFHLYPLSLYPEQNSIMGITECTILTKTRNTNVYHIHSLLNLSHVNLFIVHNLRLAFFDHWINMFMNMLNCTSNSRIAFKDHIKTLRENSMIIMETLESIVLAPSARVKDFSG